MSYRFTSTRFVSVSVLPYLVMIAGLLVAAFLIFWNLGQGSIDLRDEALTAGRSLYIYKTHDILGLEVNGVPSVRKPPLVYMLTAVSYRLFGLNELGLRLPNAVMGLGAFFVVAWGALRTLGPAWASLSAWLLLGCFNIFRVSREALTDTSLLLGLSMALIAGFLELWFKGDVKSTRRLPALFGIGVFIATFGKGLVGLYAPVFVLVAFLLLNSGRLRTYLLVSILASAPLFIWMVAEAFINPDFVSIFLGQEYLERLNYHSSFLTQFIRSPLWYASNMWRWFRLTGLVAILLGIWQLFMCLGNFRLRNSLKRIEAVNCPALIYLNLSWLGYFLMVSLASHKSRRYVLPIFPLLTLVYLVGFKIIWDDIIHRSSRALVIVLICASIFAGGVALASHYRRVPDYLPGRKAAAMALRGYLESGYAIYTDDDHLAPILHFYLDTIVPVVSSLDDIKGDRTKWVWVTDHPVIGAKRLAGYYIIVHSP